MYHSPVVQRSPTEEDDRLRRDSLAGAGVHQHPHYDRRSPTHAHIPSYSPTNGSHSQGPYNGYSSRPSTAAAMPLPSGVGQSPRLGPPPSPTSNGFSHMKQSGYMPRDPGASTYYDPTSEHRDGPANWGHSGGYSPVQSRQAGANFDKNSESKLPRSAHQSPISARFPQQSPTFPNLHAHPSSRHNSIPQSPIHTTAASPHIQQSFPTFTAQTMNGTSSQPTSSDAPQDRLCRPSHSQISEESKPTRTADPMSFSSILSSHTVDPPKSALKQMSSVRHTRRSSKTPNSDSALCANLPTSAASSTKLSGDASPVAKGSSGALSNPTEEAKPQVHKYSSAAKPLYKTTHKDNEKIQKALADIDAMDLSDIESPTWVPAKQEHTQRGQKRALEVEEAEATKRKRRRTANAKRLSLQLNVFAKAGKEKFRGLHEEGAVAEVHKKETIDEKERKKDMQRKRRREKTVQQETQKQRDAYEKMQQARDAAEKAKYMKEAQRAEKKAKSTKRILEIGEVPEEIREVTPVTLNLEGGTMSAFQSGAHVSPEPPKKKSARGPVIRPKKTKEKKKAEKDAAEAAHAAMEREELSLTRIAPKEENRRETLMRETKEPKPKEVSPAPAVTSYASKGYHQVYDQILKDIARKDIPKVYRTKDNSLATKQSNLRKTAQLAAKEARRWQLRTNKSTKDVQARAKRSMREMMSFWKRNEREERDLRRVAEKQELDNAKKAEADREANRQKRKLNFLISQTELYSHFIGRKIKTDEVERSTDSADVLGSTQTVQPDSQSAHVVEIAESLGHVGTKVTKIEELDFDADDDTILQQAAMGNAQNAIQEAQDRARAFNGEENQLQSQLDEGEMNFQNPTILGDGDVSQPRMLMAQLKEYQLKGLNWLVHLYEQGINGILADEMGLGKTVQSISVMGYLAEKHNIWGPFLVIAPSSTLHNWQQEIARFVPDLKVLPYWGNAKDRKVLRKFWDRKHITYTKESSFHVLVTSYQLVVMDVQYFQKIRWQYMILDEAQAIKSSQSSRWKCLLGFHCRNRLLLTGTPIQNNMQELWALLHFIMPSLFDSHDEFSDWFSKDIESHTQSNTKLNEDQLKRLHTILKPFMLRRIKKHVQKELGDKIERDVFCDLSYRQRALYGNLRNRISFMDLVEKAAVGDDQDTATLMNLVMQFRKVCNHPDLFERADTTSPLSLAYFAETASFMREGQNINVAYPTRNLIEYDLPRLLCSPEGRIDVAGPGNNKAGFRGKYLTQLMNIWTPEYICNHSADTQAFAWLRFTDTSAEEAYQASHADTFQRALQLQGKPPRLARLHAIYDDSEDAGYTPAHAMFNIVERNAVQALAELSNERQMNDLLEISKHTFNAMGLGILEQAARPSASAPPIEITCSNQASSVESQNTLFNLSIRRALYGASQKDEQALLEAKIDSTSFPTKNLLPPPLSEKARFTNIQVPSMRRFVTNSGKLAKLDELLRMLKNDGHRVLLYFQMTKMMDLMEEYLTYRNWKYLRLDGSTSLEDRRDTVADFQTRPEIFIFVLSTRAGGLGINLTSADTVIFYDSDWNPTIDSQAMDRAHRLGQTKQVTVYRMITRGTIEERIRKRALQKEEVQKVVISGGSGAGVDFNTRSKENRTKDIAMWLADDDQAELIEKKEKELAEKGEEPKKGGKKARFAGKRKDVSLDDMYHEGEGHFDDGSNKPSGAATPIDAGESTAKGAKKGKGKGLSKKAKTAKQRLAIADAEGDLGMGGM